MRYAYAKNVLPIPYKAILLKTRKLRSQILWSVKKETFNSFSVPMGYVKALPPQLACHNDHIDTVILHGSNAIEHTVNLLNESPVSSSFRRVLIICGWNTARIDPLLWELEPREYYIHIENINGSPNADEIGHLVNVILTKSIDLVFAMGSGSVFDAAKAAVTFIRKTKQNKHIDWAHRYELTIENDEIECVNDVLLVTIPLTPCIAGCNTIASIYNNQTIIGEELLTNDYMSTIRPDVSILQPNLLYNLPLALLHDKIVALLATSMDLIILENNFHSTLVGWNCFQKAVSLLLKSIQSCKERYERKLADRSEYEEPTMNDLDATHYSQYHKRYGHTLQESDIEDISLLSAQLSASTASYSLSPLVFLTDTYLRNIDQTIQHSFALAQVFQLYISQIAQYTAIDDLNTDRAVVRGKLETINSFLLRSFNLSSIAHLCDEIKVSYRLLNFIQDNSTADERWLPHLKVPIESIYEVHSKLSLLCGEAITAILDQAAIHHILNILSSPEAIPLYDDIDSTDSPSSKVVEELVTSAPEFADVLDEDSIDRIKKRMRELRATLTDTA